MHTTTSSFQVLLTIGSLPNGDIRQVNPKDLENVACGVPGEKT